ncbi:nucleotide sugar dehydrogenase, partial [bacterium]|nr:nucleotide sugar dehydrogenase [bacterium]
MNIAVIGSGYVGLVTGACFADLGNRVICVDNDEEKIKLLEKGMMPIYEPGLEELVKRSVKEKRLSFTTSIEKGVREAKVIFIAVGTPPKKGGEADLSSVEAVSKEIAKNMKSYKVIVEKSTVPVETGEWVKHTIKINNRNKVPFDVVSNPEFLREGSAIHDFMNPDRIVLGVES